MTRSFSIYLDFVRFFAAFLVLLLHTRAVYSPGGVLFSLGHEGVVIFFVLSGYVIAFVADTKEDTLRKYAISRITRIYSVAVPAVIATALLDWGGFSINSAAYSAGSQAWDYGLVRAISGLLFTNENWLFSIQLFSNVPYWSVNYEVWYYVGFAILTYFKGKQSRYLFLALSIFIGPKILLLMPLWWLGVFIYRSEFLRNLSLPKSIVIFAISSIGIYFYIAIDLHSNNLVFTKNLLGEYYFNELAFSREFLSDYVLSIFIAGNFVSIRKFCDLNINIFNSIEKPIRIIANNTFTLYLLHQPLILFYYAIFFDQGPNLHTMIIVLVFTLISVFIFAIFTEQKKHHWKRWIARVFDIVDSWVDGKFGTHRGLVRTLIDMVLAKFQRYRNFRNIDYAKIKRVVFVCQGNICRSPFAEYLAQTLIKTVPVTSFGLATYTGGDANATAIDVGRDYQIDLSQHSTTAAEDFTVMDGDLFMVMEDRHIKPLQRLVQNYDVQIGLLGLWCTPSFALLYDPHTLSRAYFFTCFNRIDRAVHNLFSELEATQKGT